MLTPFLTGLADDTRRIVCDHDRRFNFVAMLPAGPAPTRPLDRTTFQQTLNSKTGRVNFVAQATLPFKTAILGNEI